MVSAIFFLLHTVVHLLIYAVFIAAVLSMLISFGVVDRRNQFVYTVMDFLNRLTDPILSPIRRFIPYIGNVDISPLIAILLLEALQMVLTDINTHMVLAGLAI